MKNEATIREVLNLLVIENLLDFNTANNVSKEIARNEITIYNDMADFENSTRDRNKDIEIVITPIYNRFNTIDRKVIKARIYKVDYTAIVEEEVETEIPCECGCEHCTHTEIEYNMEKVNRQKTVYVRKIATID